EVAGGPLPGVADHLPAAKRTIPGRQRGHRNAPRRSPIEVGPLAVRRRIAPGVPPFFSSNAPVLSWLSRRGHFPLGLGRQPSAGPAAVSVGLVPVDMNDRQFRRQRTQAVIGAALPMAVRTAHPVDGMPGVVAFTPLPTAFRPKFGSAVTLVLDKP